MKEEDEKKTTKKKTATKKTTTKSIEKKKTPAKKKSETEEVKNSAEISEKKPKKNSTSTKKSTTKKTTASKKEKTVKKKEIPEIIDDIELEKQDEIEIETVPESNEETKEIEFHEKIDTGALPVVMPVKEEKIIDEITDDTIAAIPLPMEELGISSFDGKLIQLIGWILVGLILTVVTLGLGYPFAKCFILDWRFKHTKINGKRLSFDGNGLQLWGNYIKWTFFTIITLGIFLLFLPVQWNKWIVKHTHYEGNRKPKVNYSLFDGITWEYIGISILSGILNLFSFGLLAPFCNNLMYSWRINHTTYDTIDMEFDGKGFQLLGNYIKWTFFTIITLGIYGLWVPIRKLQWEVKHTHEKGYAKHPYKPILGMVLPIIFAIGSLCAQIYGLSKVPESTWKEIRTSIKEEIDSYKREIKKYRWDFALVERVADGYYRINTRDYEITWDERYERYFDSNKLDKFSENTFNNYFSGNVSLAILDLDNLDEPAILVKTSEEYRIFWLYENKIENHHFSLKNSELKNITDKDGTHLGMVVGEDNYYLYYLDDIVNYNDNSIVFAFNEKKFSEKVKEKGITLNDVDIHYTDVNIDNLDGFKNAVNYYYNHTLKDGNINSKVFNEDEVNDMFDNSTYATAYISYLKNSLEGDAKVAVLDLGSFEFPTLVVIEDNKSYILSYYNDEIFKSENFGKASIGALKKSTKKTEDYVLITSDTSYRYYYFVEAYAKNKNEYNGEKLLQIKKDAIVKNLDKYSYKEVNTSISLVKVSKKDLSSLENELNVEDEEDNDSSLENLKVGEYKLSYGDYVFSKNKGNDSQIVYSILSNGSYSYVSQSLDKKGKKVITRETGTYEIKNNKICMTSLTKNSKSSEKCFEVSNDQFNDESGVYNYTKVKTQSN